MENHQRTGEEETAHYVNNAEILEEGREREEMENELRAMLKNIMRNASFKFRRDEGEERGRRGGKAKKAVGRNESASLELWERLGWKRKKRKRGNNTDKNKAKLSPPLPLKR